MIALLTRRLRPLPLLLLALAAPAPAHAAGATLNVPAQYPTIQAAITAAANGDTVLIADGTYTGPGDVDVDFGGKNVTVTSQHGPAATIIDCGGSSGANHRAFTVQSGETAAVISGLTIENGYESSSDGGGITIYNVSLTVQNCVLKNNTAPDGGGIVNHNFAGTITVNNCTFTGNSATIVGGGGGGLYNYNEGAGRIAVEGCTLTGNTAPNGTGGGLYDLNLSSGTLSVVNCTLTGNSAGHGGGIDSLYNNSSSGPMDVTNCTLTGNAAKFSGGGVFNENAQGDGGSTSPILMTNDIVYGDGADEIADNPSSTGFATVAYCDVQGGYAGMGNISADPMFANAGAGDLHLLPGSPCIGAGTPEGAPMTDKDGHPRPRTPSIGAYDVPPHPMPATHLLWSNPDGKAAFWTLDGPGNVLGVTGYGPYTDDGGGLWHATALATGPDGLSHLLWNNPDGHVALWNVTDSGAATVLDSFGPYTDGGSLWHATGLSVGPDGAVHLLWTNPDGKAAFWNVQPNGNFSVLAGYGPFTDGSSPWAAVGVSTGPDNVSHLLWSNADGRAAFWDVSDADGSATALAGYGPYTDGGSLWGAIGVSTGPDGASHLLWSNPDGKAAFWSLGGDGGIAGVTGYGPYLDGSSLWSVIGLATGPDGVSHLLWDNPDGKAALWSLGADGGIGGVAGFGPYTDGAASNLWSAVGVSAGP